MKIAYLNKGAWQTSPLIKFSILKTIIGFLLSDERYDFDAPFRDFDHPHDIHHIQNNTSNEPSTLDYKSHSDVGFCSIDRIQEAIKRKHYSNPNNEEHHCHKNSIDDISFGKLRIIQNFEEPPEMKIKETSHFFYNTGN